MELATLCVPIKPDKLSSLTTVMKLLEKVIEKRHGKHLEDTGFLANISQVLGRPNQQMIIFYTCPRLL